MMLRHVEITNKLGKILRGYLTYPDSFNGLIVIMYHGFTGNKTEHGGHFRDFSRLLAENNIASLRMDFYGNGESDGTFKDFTFDTMFSDANLIIDYARKIDGVKNISLLGFSMGGAVASYVAINRCDVIDNIILWSPAGNIVELIKNIYEKSPKLENGNADYPNFEISKEMDDSVSKYTMYENLERFTGRVLVIHGRKDLAVNYIYGIRYSVSFPNSFLHIIDTAGHGYDKREEKIELFNKSLDFLKGC